MDPDSDARRIATLLLQRGIRPEEPVGVYLRRSSELITAILGVLYAGASYLPLDPSLPALRIQHMLENSAVRCAITDSGASDLADRVELIVRHDERIVESLDAELPVSVDPSSLA